MSLSEETQITLIGSGLAEPGQEFIYRGGTAACDDCPHRDNCLNLRDGVRYRVESVREGGQELDCEIHEGGGVRAVEVVESEVVAQVESRMAFEGSKVTVREDACDKKDCPAYKYCVPEGFDFGEPYTINEVVGKNPVDCHYDKSLRMVELEKE